MIRVKIDGKKYKLPTSAEEISIRRGIAISDLYKSEMTMVEKKNLFSYILDAPLTEIDKIQPEIFDILLNKLQYFNESKGIGYSNTFKIGKYIYGVLNLEDMNLKEYIDICVCFNNIDDYINESTNLLIRKVINKKKSFGFSVLNILLRYRKGSMMRLRAYKSYKIEKYVEGVNDILLDNVSYSYIQYILGEKVKLLNDIIKEYPILYGKAQSAADVYNRMKHPEAYSNEIDDEEDTDIYGIYNLLSNLCGDDKQKIDYWLEKPYREFLEHATYIINRKNKN